MIIKSHKDLANQIAGKAILHLNSLGKDSIVCLEWLTRFARPSRIVSVMYEFMAQHPSDKAYLNYLKKRYPTVEFIVEPNSNELNNIVSGFYQSPIEFIFYLARLEYDTFERHLQTKELKEKYGCDYVCSGFSKYESFARATKFHKKGILIGDEIFPLGMMTKDQVLSVIKNGSVKLHPCYKLNKSTFDYPTYWKMRSTFLTNPEYRKTMLRVYPLLELDEYRYEVLLKGQKK
jgi:3'-phosphoadenosine 5'-phosphosulfate sulfotransferase (PAPS reductase)/FAD synthetase